MSDRRQALGTADPNTVKKQLSTYVPEDVQGVLAAAGIGDEQVFPVPVVLEAKPTPTVRTRPGPPQLFKQLPSTSQPIT
jgi:hypothetical protein